MKHRAVIAVLAVLATSSAVAARAGDMLVLVASADSPIAEMSALAVRKAFVGLPVTVNGQPVRALLNDSDPTLRPAFLQHVVGFTESAYQRRVLTLTIRQGRSAPPSYEVAGQLLAALRRNPYAVTYMWLRAAESLPDVRVIRPIWQQE